MKIQKEKAEEFKESMKIWVMIVCCIKVGMHLGSKYLVICSIMNVVSKACF